MNSVYLVKNLFITTILLFSLISTFLLKSVNAQSSGSVDVTANVYACVLRLTVYPEKRIPTTNNWQTNLDIQIHSLAGSYLGTVLGSSNNLGVSVINTCDQSVSLAHDNYDLYVKGLSHLRMRFPNHELFRLMQTDVNLTTLGQLLFAGETSNVYDNYINTLDISTQITTYQTTDNKNDLNQDGVVNVLDISNTITNYLLSGDCSPKDSADGVC